jgi:hypothetical protein
MENRSGLVVGAVVSHADGFAERACNCSIAWAVIPKRLGADNAYDTREFIRDRSQKQSWAYPPRIIT